MKQTTNMRTIKQTLSLMILLCSANFYQGFGQNKPIFPKGEKAPNVTQYVGNIWRTQLNSADSIFTFGTSTVTYDPGARLNWHSHPGGQMLMITDGIGYYQERGKVKRIIRRGDVIKCMPNIDHWHGATPESGVTYIAVTPAQKGGTVWLKKVTDEEYNSEK